MSDFLLRRDFLKVSLAAVAAPGVAPQASSPAKPKPAPAIKPEAGADKLTTYQFGPQIWIRWANQLLTSYRAHPTQKYPYLYPVAGPVTGLSLTSESSVPFPHHRSLLFACDHVNGANYWQTEMKDGQVLSGGPKLGPATPTSAQILDQCQWHKPGEPAVLTDQRKITVSVVSPRLRLIDAEIQWTAVQDVTVTKTNHSLFALRAAPDIIPWGGGTLLNSAGLQGEKATFGKTAAWCGYYGRRQGVPGNVVEGIVLMDHPKNPWAPTPWFTRDYGFISPSPFNFIDKPWQLSKGQSVMLRYRVVLHAGDPQEAEIAKIYRTWAAT
jgi:hypothetical protein